MEDLFKNSIDNSTKETYSVKSPTATTATSTATATTAVSGHDAASAEVASSVDEVAISLPPNDPPSSAIDEISGSMTAQVFELCETDIFRETLQTSEVTSSSHGYYDENSSYTANLSFPSDVDDKYSTEPLEPNKFQNDPNDNVNASTTTSSSTTTTATTTAIANNSNNFSIIFDPQDEFDNDISASIDFSTSPPFSGAPYLSINHQDQLDFSSVEPQAQLNDISVGGLLVPQYQADPVIPFMAPPLPSVYEDDCLSMMPPFLPPNPSVSASYFPVDPSMGSFFPGSLNASVAADSAGNFTGSMLVGSEVQPKEPEYYGDSSGMFCPDQLQRVYNSSDTLSLSSDNQQLVNGAVSTPLSTEISNSEDPSYKVGKLSVEQRKEKIHKYMKKRNERNFSKKIKYACRKTLADSRPRVRGRFAKNDELGDAHRQISGHHEEDEYDDASVKEEDDLVSSSDIFARINGMNSFNCGYSIHSWI